MGRVYVNQSTGNDAYPGSEFLPLMSFGAALNNPQNNEIFIEDGIYSEVIDSTKFDLVRRRVIGFGDVYFDAQGSSSLFTGSLVNRHVFKNIKFVNHGRHPMKVNGGNVIFSSCFFKPFAKIGSNAVYVGSPNSSVLSTIVFRKCTILDCESVIEIDPSATINNLGLDMQNTLFYGYDFDIRRLGEITSFSQFLSSDQDKGNYYKNNTHLSNGGFNSLAFGSENPPLFVNSLGGNYDLLPSSSLVGGGYLGSDIGSFHEFSPFTSTGEPVSIFDAGWRNDDRYYDSVLNIVGPDGPADAAPLKQIILNGLPRWVIDLAKVPLGKSARLISPVIDFKLVRKITRASWSAFENLALPSGTKQVLSNTNGVTADLEMRWSLVPFVSDTNPSWVSFDRSTSINSDALYAQFRVVFRLNGV